MSHIFQVKIFPLKSYGSVFLLLDNFNFKKKKRRNVSILNENMEENK